MPERGFYYFPSPERGSDALESIAHQFLYCSTAVAEWSAFRQHLETTGLRSQLQCDQIEKNAIDVFREVRDVMFEAIETDDLPRMKDPKLLQRLMLAHGYLALHANASAMGEYRNMAWAEMPQGQQANWPRPEHFAKALWEGKWNEPADNIMLLFLIGTLCGFCGAKLAAVLLSRRELEGLVADAIFRLGDNAHGLAIYEQIEILKPISLGTLYAVLARLEKKGYITSLKGDPIPERSNRRRRFYALIHKLRLIFAQLHPFAASWR
jgi:hypothetical protein